MSNRLDGKDTEFEDRVVVITGAGTGLGRAHALWFASRGAKVVVNSRKRAESSPTALAVVREITESGGVAVHSEQSVENESGSRALIEFAYSYFGKLDILVCNAGISPPLAPLTEVPLDVFREVMDVNFYGSLYPIYAALPKMIACGYGRIVVTTSTAGYYGEQGAAAYSASKAALIGLVRSIGIECKDTKVKANLIAPVAYTRLMRDHVNPRAETILAPGRVSPVIGWLSSERCNRSGLIITGGGGRFYRAGTIEGPIHKLDADDVSDLWPRMKDLEGGTESESSFEPLLRRFPELVG